MGARGGDLPSSSPLRVPKTKSTPILIGSGETQVPEGWHPRAETLRIARRSNSSSAHRLPHPKHMGAQWTMGREYEWFCVYEYLEAVTDPFLRRPS